MFEYPLNNCFAFVIPMRHACSIFYRTSSRLSRSQATCSAMWVKMKLQRSGSRPHLQDLFIFALVLNYLKCSMEKRTSAMICHTNVRLIS